SDRARRGARRRDRTGQGRHGPTADVEVVRRPAARERDRPAVQGERRGGPRRTGVVHRTRQRAHPRRKRLRGHHVHGRDHRDGRGLQKLGVEVHVKSQARGWRVDKDQTVVDVVTPDGLIARRADLILVTVGRRPNTDDLATDKAGVEVGPRGYIKVDRQLRTTNPHVFAIGDVIGPPFLAHKATKEGLIAAEAIAGHPVEVDYRAMPAAIFTDPEIATVGMQESEAAAKGRKVRVGRVPFAAIGRALTTGEYDGFVKLLADADSKVFLGGTIVGPDASDLISELALAIEMGATITDIALTVHPHPTLPEGIMESAEAALGQAIHVLNR